MKRISRFTRSSKNIDQLYKEGQCRQCTVVVTRMDFAKILGKFTKVKIQYESTTSPVKTKASSVVTSPNTNSRLKSNENGMVLIHRNAYKEHPVKDATKKPNQEHPVKDATKKPTQVKNSPIIGSRTVTRSVNNNVLKENNRLKKTPLVKERIAKPPPKLKTYSRKKRYCVTFANPTSNVRAKKNKISLLDLLPSVDKSLLPTEEWCIHYLPNTDEPKEDKVYDRIAAELEDLMYSEKTILKSEGMTENSDGKGDGFPSILDILNEKPSVTEPNDQVTSTEPKSNLASNDVEAMLLGSNPENSNVNEEPMDINEPASPSILDEALEKGFDKQFLKKADQQNESKESEPMDMDEAKEKISKKALTKIEIDTKGPAKEITHLVFKKLQNGTCMKSVTCPKTLEYNIELIGKPIELLGAPKYVSSREDLKVLLQIVNDSELGSLHVMQ